MSMKHVIVSTSIGVLAWRVPLSAHVPDLVTPDRLWISWTFEPLVVIPLALAVWLYTRGVARVRTGGGGRRAISGANVLSFAGGIAVLVAALASPLDSLGGTLLSAHMAQHGLLAGVAPPLLLMGRPGVAFAWGLKPAWSVEPRAFRLWRSMLAAARRLSTPALATLLQAAMLWVWHAPALFDAAVAHDWVHAIQHLCFFVPGLFFWRALLDGDAPRRAAASVVAAFATFVHTGLLGGLLTMASEPLYPVYLGRPALWRLTALQDQQLAGVLMWVPLGLPYLVVGLWLASRVLTLDAPVRAHSASVTRTPIEPESVS
jgi:putative membrane protein